jgi:hypothetical protein
MSPTEVFERVSPLVVIVEALAANGRPFGQGSGVILDRALVVTNHHVVDGASGVRVRQGRRQWPAKVRRANRDHDLALLSVDGLGTSAMPLRTSSELKAGERVWAVGAPQALELSLSEGIISGLRPAEAAKLIQTTASISPGSSGGGLFDDRARLLGITTFQFLGGQNLNFALPAEWVQEIAAPSGAEAKSNGDRPPAAITAVTGQPSAVDQLCARGREQLMAGHSAEALASFGAALAKDPESAPAWFGTGLVQVRRHDSTGALKTYERLKGLDPNLAKELLDFIRDPQGRLTPPASDIGRDELDRLQIVGKAAFGDALSVNLANGTDWNLTAISVQVVGREGSYELICTAREGILPSATGLLRTTSGPPGGWSRANWVIVGARGFKR